MPLHSKYFWNTAFFYKVVNQTCVISFWKTIKMPVNNLINLRKNNITQLLRSTLMGGFCFVVVMMVLWQKMCHPFGYLLYYSMPNWHYSSMPDTIAYILPEQLHVLIGSCLDSTANSKYLTIYFSLNTKGTSQDGHGILSQSTVFLQKSKNVLLYPTVFHIAVMVDIKGDKWLKGGLEPRDFHYFSLYILKGKSEQHTFGLEEVNRKADCELLFNVGKNKCENSMSRLQLGLPFTHFEGNFFSSLIDL